MTEKTKFVQNQLVMVRGQKEPCRISWPMKMAFPVIQDGEFILGHRIMYKFVTAKKSFYAWEEDITAAKEIGGRINAKGRMRK